ncbi:hypothetical protein O6H91_01G098100 [Diphasiastrum complanatum]|uniref:Uncharacterized protein n=1 Tax=Diphasiastrum complanatum TaxID=34168 RepID=A0ACC2ETH1_DIPCM|nr:hypothetical protein O6H91_01G098100 [Diphasiastrum complanatum]
MSRKLYILVIYLVTVSLRLGSVSSQLSVDFYQQTCPNVDSIVTKAFTSIAQQDNVVPSSLLRLFAHDCFVEGCDGSILISSTANNTAERDAADNINFPPNPFDAMAKVKKTVEAACPGVVSCADILAMGARDVVVFAGGPSWNVFKGRRDGRISEASRTAGLIPGANFNVDQLVANFALSNLTVSDMIVLSGAHTVGFSHCQQFTNRLYKFSSNVTTDPSMSRDYAAILEKQCPQFGGDPGTVQAFDITTPFTFDNDYYQDLQQGKGLLFSDQVLFNDLRTRDLVNQLAANQTFFFSAFTQAMIKFGMVGVKTGSVGEIRRDCAVVN